MFEHRHDPLLARSAFLLRLARSASLAGTVVATALALGMLGYHFIVGLPWIDSFLNAAMILSGMGPVDAIRTSPGKIFAGSYALLSGLVVLTTAAMLLGPIVHRMLHRFHRASRRDRFSPSDADHCA